MQNKYHTTKCPDINCHGGKDCCPFRKIVIPAVMGDDSEDSPAAPENGAYRNALIEYEANGAMYIYASDGIYTKISMVAGGAGAATIQYVDGKVTAEAVARQNGDAATLAAAKDYTDSHVTPGSVTQQYVDQHDTATLNSAKDYADSIKPTKTSDLTNDGSDGLSTYADMDSLANVALSGSYDDLTDAPTLATVATSGDYDDLTDTPVLATVATSGSYNDLSDKPTIPTITMTSSDPGEGSALAANTFIGVYNG